MNAINASGEIKPFTRVINTPAAFPWDQNRAANLEARHTSPVSSGMTGAELTIVVKRLEPWRPRIVGRFIAVYLRGAVPPQGLTFSVDVQGRSVRVDIGSPAAQAEALRQKAWIAGAAVIMGLSLVGQVGLTLKRRADIEQRLATLEPQVERAAKLTAGSTRLRQNAQALDELQLRGRTTDDFVEALRTVTLSRDPAARIESFMWDSGDWALEVRGDATPLKAGAPELQRAPKPVRRGVWLWVRTKAPPATTHTAISPPSGDY